MWEEKLGIIPWFFFFTYERRLFSLLLTHIGTMLLYILYLLIQLKAQSK